MKIIRTLLPAFSGIMLASMLSNGCAEKAKTVVDEEITTDTASADAKLRLDEIFVNIPSPTVLAKELSKAGVNYNRGILNSPSRSGSYSTNYKAAVNLGVFGADLGYTSAYGQTQDALGYLNSIKQLADKVGVGAAFDEAVIKRFESNANNKDSIEVLINSAYDKANRNLRSNARVSTAAVVSAGGWIESLYVSASVLTGSTKNDKNEQAYTRVWNQIYAYRYVYELLNYYQKNPDCSQMLKDLQPVGEIIDAYTKKPALTAEDIKAINDKINPIRTQLVN